MAAAAAIGAEERILYLLREISSDTGACAAGTQECLERGQLGDQDFHEIAYVHERAVDARRHVGELIAALIKRQGG